MILGSGGSLPCKSRRAISAKAVSAQGAPSAAQMPARWRACSCCPALSKFLACSSRAIGWNSITCNSTGQASLVMTLNTAQRPSRGLALVGYVEDNPIPLQMPCKGCACCVSAAPRKNLKTHRSMNFFPLMFDLLSSDLCLSHSTEATRLLLLILASIANTHNTLPAAGMVRASSAAPHCDKNASL